MTDTLVFLNGSFLPRREASVDVLDRGTLFGDGVYEVIRYVNGRGFAMDRHLARLERSLKGVALPLPMMLADLEAACDDLVARRGLSEAKLYLQITRGPAARNHVMPDRPEPSVLLVADEAGPIPVADRPPPSVSARTTEDNRWGDCWIKSLMLLPNSLAKTQAKADGFDDAIFVRPIHPALEPGTTPDLAGGTVTESTVANVMIVTGGVIRTHPADRRILPGVTRAVLIELAGEARLAVEQTPFTLAELLAADEVIICGTTSFVSAATRIDDTTVADGKPGPVTTHLHELLLRRIAETCGVGPERG